MNIQVSKNFDILQTNYSDKRGVILEGGSRSGKTYAIIQFLTIYLLEHKGITITIGRETLTDIKDTILPDMFEIFQEFGVLSRPDYKRNKSEKHISFNDNATTEF